jgi:predicted NUDIX family NTP pyrophosphohydrolase
MAVRSAGILAFRIIKNEYEFLLVHPGGPFWKNKDENTWSIPKGLVENDEEELHCAIREFQEETGFEILPGNFIELKGARQSSGKVIKIWAIEADFDPTQMKSNLFKMEWPPKSGKFKQFPEADKAEWFNLDVAKTKIVKGQIPILDDLNNHLLQF